MSPTTSFTNTTNVAILFLGPESPMLIFFPWITPPGAAATAEGASDPASRAAAATSTAGGTAATGAAAAGHEPKDATRAGNTPAPRAAQNGLWPADAGSAPPYGTPNVFEQRHATAGG